MKSNKRTMFLLILLLLIGAVGYPILKGGDGPDLEAVKEPVIDAGVSQMLNDLMGTKLDTSVLNGPELSGLTDFTLPLASLPVGRPNPFAPLK
jgi:hypothetical protein